MSKGMDSRGSELARTFPYRGPPLTALTTWVLLGPAGGHQPLGWALLSWLALEILNYARVRHAIRRIALARAAARPISRSANWRRGSTQSAD